jgi:hypothetical protein
LFWNSFVLLVSVSHLIAVDELDYAKRLTWHALTPQFSFVDVLLCFPLVLAYLTGVVGHSMW